MPIVRMHMRDAGSLVGEYTNAVGQVRGAMGPLSTLVSEAHALLETGGQHPLYGPLPALQTVTTELSRDGDDLAWRVDFIRNTDSQPLDVSGQVSAYVPANLDAAFEAAGLTALQIEAAMEMLNAGVSFTDAVEAAKSDGLVLPDWNKPEELSDAELIWSIQNWPGSDNDPILDELVREFNNRAEPEGGWISLGQHQVATENFAAGAYGFDNHLEPWDRIGADLVEELQAAGFDEDLARDIAADLRTQFPGDEIALYEGFKAAIEQLENNVAISFGNDVSYDDFSLTLDTAGEESVLGHNRDFLEASKFAIETAADQSGHAVTDEAIAAIIAYAVRNGTTVGAAARQYFGLDAERPPAGFDKADLLAPELLEIDIRITQEEATLEAIDELGNTEFTDEVWAAMRSKVFSDFDGDGHPDYTVNPDGQIVVSGYGTDPTADFNRILTLVGDLDNLEVGSDDAWQQQSALVEHLKNVELSVSLVANDDELDLLDSEQLAVLETLNEHDWVFDLLSYHRDAPHPDWGIWNPWTTGSIEHYLEWYSSPEFPHDIEIPPEAVAALHAMLDDPELLHLLADRSSGDLWQDVDDPTQLDFGRLETAAERQALGQVLAPYADTIDTARRGDQDGTRVPEDLDAFIEWANDPVNLVPRRVIEAAQAARSAGFTDTNVLNQIHLGLDILGTTEIPVVSQLADAVNAGLYLVVDRDLVNAGISAVGVVGTGVVLLRNGTRIVGRAADYGDSVVSLARSADIGIDPGTLNAGVNLTTNTRRVPVTFGRSGERVLYLPGDFVAGDVVTVTFNVRRSSGWRRLGTRADRAAYEVEYVRQLDRQEAALNNMSAEDYLDARQQFLANGRNPVADREQQTFRTTWKTERSQELEAEALEALDLAGTPVSPAKQREIAANARTQAEGEATALAALHEPDMVAGGYNHPTPQDMGWSNVNSSIGSSWRTRVNQIDAAAQLLVDAERGGDTLTVSLAPAGG